MKKRGRNKPKKEDEIPPILICLILLALILFILIFKNLVLTTNVIQNHLTPKVIENPPTPENCSNESIKKVWEFIFKGSSENLTITSAPYNNTNSSEEESELWSLLLNEKCPAYSVYQINGTNIRTIIGIDVWFLMNMKMVIAIDGNYPPEEMENIIQRISSSEQNEMENAPEYLLLNFLANRTIKRNINTSQEAKTEFESVFNISSSNWTKEEFKVDGITENLTAFSFFENGSLENITLFGESIDPMGIIAKAGMVLQNYSMNTYLYTDISLLAFTKELERLYGNWTSPINTSLKNIEVKINDSKLKMSEEIGLFSESRSGIQRIEINQDEQTIIETEINFTEEGSLDWTKIILKKQETDSTRGYIIINGLNYTKNVTVDRLNDKSESVCIKDKEIYSIDEISPECNAIDEYILECPGNLTSTARNLTCNISGNKFIITGLEHSAILEIIPPEIPCVQNWQCDEWSETSKSCGYRTCTDLNNCGNITGKPLEYQECPVCIPNWKCTQFLPEKCPREEKRTRTCTDINDCGTEKGKPELTQTCERKNILVYILITLLGIAVIILIVIILKRIIIRREKLKERPRTEQGQYKNDPNYPSQIEQYYGSDQTHNFKEQPETNPQSENYQEKFPDKYWPK